MRLWPPRFGGYFLHIGMAPAGSTFPMIRVAEAPVNINHQSYFITADHNELLVGWDRRALSAEVVEVGEGGLVKNVYSITICITVDVI